MGDYFKLLGVVAVPGQARTYAVAWECDADDGGYTIYEGYDLVAFNGDGQVLLREQPIVVPSGEGIDSYLQAQVEAQVAEYRAACVRAAARRAARQPAARAAAAAERAWEEATAERLLTQVAAAAEAAAVAQLGTPNEAAEAAAAQVAQVAEEKAARRAAAHRVQAARLGALVGAMGKHGDKAERAVLLAEQKEAEAAAALPPPDTSGLQAAAARQARHRHGLQVAAAVRATVAAYDLRAAVEEARTARGPLPAPPATVAAGTGKLHPATSRLAGQLQRGERPAEDEPPERPARPAPVPATDEQLVDQALAEAETREAILADRPALAAALNPTPDTEGHLTRDQKRAAMLAQLQLRRLVAETLP